MRRPCLFHICILRAKLPSAMNLYCRIRSVRILESGRGLLSQATEACGRMSVVVIVERASKAKSLNDGWRSQGVKRKAIAARTLQSCV